MSFFIDHGMVPETQTFTAVTDRVGTCGAITYTIIGSLQYGTAVVDQASLTISVDTNNGLDVGTHQFTLRAQMDDYPQYISDAIFDVTVTSQCANTEILQTHVSNKYYV